MESQEFVYNVASFNCKNLPNSKNKRGSENNNQKLKMRNERFEGSRGNADLDSPIYLYDPAFSLLKTVMESGFVAPAPKNSYCENSGRPIFWDTKGNKWSFYSPKNRLSKNKKLITSERTELGLFNFFNLQIYFIQPKISFAKKDRQYSIFRDEPLVVDGYERTINKPKPSHSSLKIEKENLKYFSINDWRRVVYFYIKKENMYGVESKQKMALDVKDLYKIYHHLKQFYVKNCQPKNDELRSSIYRVNSRRSQKFKYIFSLCKNVSARSKLKELCLTFDNGSYWTSEVTSRDEYLEKHKNCFSRDDNYVPENFQEQCSMLCKSVKKGTKFFKKQRRLYRPKPETKIKRSNCVRALVPIKHLILRLLRKRSQIFVSSFVSPSSNDLRKANKLYEAIWHIRNLAKEEQIIYETFGNTKVRLRTKVECKIKPFDIVPIELEVARTTELQRSQQNEMLDGRMMCIEASDAWTRHDDLMIIECISQYGQWRVLVENITNKEVIIKVCSEIAVGRVLSAQQLPSLHPDGMIELTAHVCSGRLEEKLDVLSEKTPKQLAEAEFVEMLDKYKDQPEVWEVLKENKSCFVPTDEYMMPKLNIDPVCIPIKADQIESTPPVSKRNYKDIDIEAINTFVEAGLLNGLLVQAQSNCVSPLHVVRTSKYDDNGNKVSEKVRPVIDLRVVNKINLQDFHYPFPDISTEVLRLTAKNYKYFSSTDLSKGFNQLEIDKESMPLFTFPVWEGKYHNQTFAYTRLCFGAKSAPSIFASVINNCFARIENSDNSSNFVQYIDDLAWASESLEDHVLMMKRFFARCQKFNLKLSASKCKFAAPNIIFCGHLISSKGAEVSPKRIKLLDEYPDFDVAGRRKNNDLSMLGFYGYHSRFVSQYSKRDRKMRDLIKKYKNKTISRDDCNQAIKIVTDEIKGLIKKSVIIAPCKDDELLVVCDASQRSWGGVIMCDRGIISYAAGSFTEQLINTHGAYLLELRALGLVLQTFYKYLTMGKNITIKSDSLSSTFAVTGKAKASASNRACQYILNIQTWLATLNYKIVHLAGKDNTLCDALSRLSYDKDGNFIECDEVPRPELFFSKVNEDVAVRVAAIRVQNNEKSPKSKNKDNNLPIYPEKSTSKDGCSFALPHWNIPREDELFYYKSIHDRTHMSSGKMFQTLKSYGYKPNKDMIESVVILCETCKPFRKVGPLSKLKPWATPSTELQEIHLDFIVKNSEHLQSIRGHKAILTMIDTFSRYGFAFPMRQLTISPVVEKLREIFTVLGRKFLKIYGDNAFNAAPLVEFCKNNNIELKFRASHLSRSVIVERWHREIHSKLTSFCGHNPRNWDLHLSEAVTSLNRQVHSAHEFTPYFLVFGHDPENLSEMDQRWNVCKEFAKIASDAKKDKHRSTYIFPSLEPGMPVHVFYENGKNAEPFKGVVVSDEGGSEAEIQIEGYHATLKIHKGHLQLKKSEKGFRAIFKMPASLPEAEFLINNKTADGTNDQKEKSQNEPSGSTEQPEVGVTKRKYLLRNRKN